MTLYVFGNGFDIYHGLKTRCFDYKKYLEDNKKNHPEWHIILDYFPKSSNFWSDFEYNICSIDVSLFKELKTIYGTSFLDDLKNQINNSFIAFIKKACDIIIDPKFTFDNDSLFINFNYTPLLEDVYNIKRGRITYIHNDIRGFDLNRCLGLYYPLYLIIGHAKSEDEYMFHPSDDNEYISFRKETEKCCEDNIKNKRVDKLLEINAIKINKVVFFGFSFSNADKRYVEYLFEKIPPSKTKYIIYYHKEDGESGLCAINKIKKQLSSITKDLNAFVFADSDSAKAI